MPFIWTLSDYQIYEILGLEGSVASSIVKHYITELVSRRKCDLDWDSKSFVFIRENSKMHSNKLISHFLGKSKLKKISTPQYTPVLNPWEKLINSIKAKIKLMHSEGR